MKKRLVFCILLLFFIFCFYSNNFSGEYIVKNKMYNNRNIVSSDKIHFIKNEDDAGDSIIIQTGTHCAVIDTMNPSTDSSIC